MSLKKKYSRFGGILFFATFIFVQLKAQENNLLFTSFFAEKNLSSKNISFFFQDSKGYMWIGTEDGLNYFNGKTIKVFKHDYLNKNSLVDNLIGSISEDKDGFIWIGTAQGISRLDPGVLTFENFTLDDKKESLGYKPNVYVDKENTVWVFSSSIFRFNKSKHAFEKIVFKSEEPKDHIFNGVFEDSQKRFWISSSENLYRFFPDENKREVFAHFKRKVHFFAVKEDQKGNLFCSTWDDGVYKINPGSGTLDTIEKDGYTRTWATQVLNGKTLLWTGTNLSSRDLGEKKVTHYSNEKSNPNSWRNAEISTLFTDAQNQLWIGYSSKGIQIVSPSNQSFKTIKIAQKENDFPLLNGFAESKYFFYVGGWYNYSLARLDKNYHTVKTWKSILPQIGNVENNISDSWNDQKGNIWFTSTFGLIKFNEATEKTELFKLDSSISKRSFFLQMLPEGDSVLWLSGYFCGLSRFSLKTKTFQNWEAKNRALYWGITKDNEGILWLADNGGTLTGFDPKNKNFIVKKYNELTEGVIYNSIHFDSKRNYLWVCSSNGLLRVDRKTFQARLFTEKDNLPTNQVNAVQCDKQDRLWIATNKGLCFFDFKNGVVKTFNTNNGLPDNMLNQLFKILPDGNLLIGFRDGFSILNTNALQFEKSSQIINITKLYEAGKIVPIVIENGQKIIQLNYDQNNLQIEFSSNDLINSEDNQLLFRLEGYDNQWYTAQDGKVNYSKLAPGKYLFHASGTSHSGLKSLNDDFLTIIIHPPYWKTTWFIILASAFLFIVTLLAARYVFTRNLREKILILEKEQAIDKERSRISQDMHDELGSGLTKISIMSEVAMTQLSNSPKAKNQLENISSSSRELVDNLQDIIWVLSPKNDSLENLSAYLREYALKYFEPLDTDVKVDFPEKISAKKLSEDQRRNILLVFKESFNNISKHSHATQVSLKMTETGSAICFSISDNGKGFDKEKIRNFANGLYNMEKRMSHINGTFKIHSVLNVGTTSEFCFTV